MHYVIIGNGVASIGAVEGIREHDAEGPITILTDEGDACYGRPLISYYLAETIGEDKLPLRQESFYAAHGVELKLGARVAAIDTAARTVTEESGEAFGYDRLLIATGGAPFIPGIEGAEGPGVFTFTQKCDAESLMEAAKTAKKVAVVGAGLIALKAAEALVMKGLDVTLVVRSRIMRAYMDETAGRLIVDHLAKNGLNFLQAGPTAVTRDAQGKVTAVETDQGALEADLVIMAAGVRPAKALAEAAGIDCGMGVKVDERLAASAPDVFAAGDVAEGIDMFTGESVVMPIWPNAYHQGHYAGRNMAGANAPYAGTLNMNSITYFGLPTMSVGLANASEADGFEVHIHHDEVTGVYRKLAFKTVDGEERLMGCILIGEVDHAGLYTSFIKNRFAVTPEAKEELLKGEPSPLAWPSEFIADKMEGRPAV